MQKRKILYHAPLCSFNSDWIVPILDQYFEFEPRESGRVYPRNTLCYVNMSEAQTGILEQLLDQGFRVIVDNLWEVNAGYKIPVHPVICEKWFWYNESLWYHHRGYHNYLPNKNVQYKALMPMNRKKPHRNAFLNKINTDQLLWSYCETGRQLPNDRDMSDWDTQRYFNPDWYDQTYCSMVVESVVRPASKYTPIFITEKTMKPLAFQHPLIVYGNRGILRTLRQWGFETFDNLWDESYDEIVDMFDRTDAIVKLLADVTVQDYDAETRRRIQHNRNHFFDHSSVINGIVQDIVEPILHYAEA